MAQRPNVSSKASFSFRSVKYEMQVDNPGSMKRSEAIESDQFEVRGLRCKLAVRRCVSNCGSGEVLEVLVVSQNAKGVFAVVSLDATIGDERRNLIKRARHVACPYSTLCVGRINFEELTNSQLTGQPEKTLILEVVVKDVSPMDRSELSGTRDDVRTVSLEIINSDSIKAWLCEDNVFELCGPDRIRHSDVYACSFVRLWANESPDRRFWLFNRSPKRKASLQKCLNGTDVLKRFDDICTQDSRAHPWVTVFEEAKDSNQDFEPIEDDTILVFCKISESTHDVSYLGHLLVKKTMSCNDLLSRISNDLAQFPNGTFYNAYLEAEGYSLNITSCRTPLNLCGVHHGSTVVLTERGSAISHLSVWSQPVPDLADAQAPIHQPGNPEIDDRLSAPDFTSQLPNIPRKPQDSASVVSQSDDLC